MCLQQGYAYRFRLSAKITQDLKVGLNFLYFFLAEMEYLSTSSYMLSFRLHY